MRQFVTNIYTYKCLNDSKGNIYILYLDFKKYLNNNHKSICYQLEQIIFIEFVLQHTRDLRRVMMNNRSWFRDIHNITKSGFKI